MRIYLPTTLEQLATWSASASIPSDAERFVADAEDEEHEYAALMSAADASAALPAAAGRRVVVAAEVAQPDGDVAWRDVASVHADPTARPAGADPDEDLGWYAVQELPDLLEG